MESLSGGIFNVFLNIVIFLANLILTPFIEFFKSVVPGTADLINNVSTYISTFFHSVPLVLDLLMIPRGAIILLFDYLSILLTIYLTLRFISFFVNIKRIFK